jgi:hypothetical protein
MSLNSPFKNKNGFIVRFFVSVTLGEVNDFWPETTKSSRRQVAPS